MAPFLLVLNLRVNSVVYNLGDREVFKVGCVVGRLNLRTGLGLLLFNLTISLVYYRRI